MSDSTDTTTTNAGHKTTLAKEHSKAGNAWTALAVFVILLLLLAIFILQNSNKVQINFLSFHGSLSFGVGMLLAAIAGSILTLLIGSVRILQLKSQRNRAVATHAW
ncbi:MAG: lipopolysaccharide assembly protein LapA domain-containing protein [Patescibacteria group bacterium]|nr:lipopolysaccharide assembly protein LapA domain-containing protein [Patescibacteria group bacterium]